MAKNKKKGTFWADFKAFAMKGNIIDMAVGVVVGGAFGKIVTSLVNDILMPCIGWLVGGVDFTQLKVELKGTLASNAIQAVSDVAESTGVDALENLSEAVDSLAAAAPTGDVAVASVAEMAQQSVYLNYGIFIQQFIDFIIIALCIFLVIRLLTISSRKKAEKEAAAAAEAAAQAAATKSEDVVLLEEIRDLLKNQK